MRLPDFLIIGAMKSATSTLHEQLAKQSNIVMSNPKEPYFFSDDPVYAQGIAWYAQLFAHAPEGALCGESTTHYAKLPTYPKTVTRIAQHLPKAKFIYILRHPIDRLISQYIHQWTEGEIEVPITQAIDRHPELISYSRYTYQMQPYFEKFGRDRLQILFFDRLKTHPQEELERVCRFIGYKGEVKWHFEDDQRNVSADRMRVNPLRDALVNAPIISTIRKKLIPQAWRDRVKAMWQMRERPQLSEKEIAHLTDIFNADLAVLSELVGVQLDCANFKQVTRDLKLP